MTSSWGLGNETDAPSNNSTNHTVVPTMAPSSNSTNHTVVPTMAPSNNSTNHTVVPTMAPSNNSTNHTTNAPSTAAPTTLAPHPSPHTPTVHPTVAPKSSSHLSFWRILGKTIGWLIMIFLGVLAFGFVMNHRYRIYYFLRGVWFTLLGLPCTNYILAKLGIRHDAYQPTNTILFDNELSEGLLMQES